MREIELLAPAKDIECGIQAVKCGADAVYIGANKFGARKMAGNDIAGIEKLIKFAHQYRAKVYLALNTILTDSEITEARQMVYDFYNIGIDAVIIQDFGLLQIDLPPIPLFASTQTHNDSLDKVKLMESLGFSRVILARELSLAEIRDIKTCTEIELEFFIHGSLCVCYSGQCYLSCAIGGRSANRGECAQPCRKCYSVEDSSGKTISKDRHPLSLRDLNLSENLEDLVEAGISSFKIEGRLRDINYVTNIVSFYRQKLDSVLSGLPFKKSSSGKSFIDFTPDPYKTFNRGYTDYFIDGRKENVCSIDTPKSTGEPIGKVTYADGRYFKIQSDKTLSQGDGICFFDKNNNLQGTTINKIDGANIFVKDKNMIFENMFIYRNYDHEFTKKLSSSKVDRKITVDFEIRLTSGGLLLSVVDEDGVTAQHSMDLPFEQAQNPESISNTIKNQLSKLGDTEFMADKIEINLNPIPFINIKTLNELRRETISKLSLNRALSYKRKIVERNVKTFDCFPKEIDYTYNSLNSYSRRFYLERGADSINPAAESGIDMTGKKVMTTKHCLKYQFNLCPKYNKNKITGGFKEPFYLIDEHGKKYLLVFNCEKCVMEIVF